MTEVVAGPATPERAEIQRKTLRVLIAGQIFGSAGIGAAVAVGPFIVADMLGSGRAAGAATATVTIGSAVSSIPLSRLMRRKGRRPGLRLGYALAVAGAAFAVLGAQQRWLALFLAGSFFFGMGQASNLLARYAAADLAEPEHRSRAISGIIFASTFGAVFGPLLIGPAEWVAENWLGMWKYSGPYLFSAFFYGIAGLNVALRLRPDPLVVAGGVVPSGEGAPKPPPVLDALRVISRRPRARLALLAMVVSQAAMVAVMTMTPLHMKSHGYENLSQYVVSVHIAGMYALSPLVGRFADSKGRLEAISVGAAVLIASTLVAAVAGEVHILLFVALWLLGLGWNFGLIGGSSLLTESVPLDQRVQVQGSADLMMSLCGGIAGFSSGFIREALGYHMLANLGTLAAGVLIIVTLSSLQSDRRTLAASASGGG